MNGSTENTNTNGSTDSYGTPDTIVISGRAHSIDSNGRTDSNGGTDRSCSTDSNGIFPYLHSDNFFPHPDINMTDCP